MAATEERDEKITEHEIRIVHSLSETFGMRRLSEITRLILNAVKLSRQNSLTQLLPELSHTGRLSLGALEGYSRQKNRSLGT